MRKRANRDGMEGVEMKTWKQRDRYAPSREFVLRTTHYRVIGGEPGGKPSGCSALPRGPGSPGGEPSGCAALPRGPGSPVPREARWEEGPSRRTAAQVRGFERGGE
mmetsp:Transcript_37857/g.62293  ORF Transcript_37857/g.62293 Transcript_37857/m.62293 type:complete len:106 (+) Transcript_37857:1059-1376(+)